MTSLIGIAGYCVENCFLNSIDNGKTKMYLYLPHSSLPAFATSSLYVNAIALDCID